MGMCLFECALQLVASEDLEVRGPADLDFRCVPVGVTKTPGVVYDPGDVGGQGGLVRRCQLDEVMHHPLSSRRRSASGRLTRARRSTQRAEGGVVRRAVSVLLEQRARAPAPATPPPASFLAVGGVRPCRPGPLVSVAAHSAATPKARTAREISPSALAGQWGGHPAPLCAPRPFSGGRSARTTDPTRSRPAGVRVPGAQGGALRPRGSRA